MVQSAEDVFRARIAARDEEQRQREIDRVKRETEEAEQAQLFIPELKQAAAEAVKRLRKAGWPDWQGGELKFVYDEDNYQEEKAVWRITNINGSTVFLGSDAKIYVNTSPPETDEVLISGVEWTTCDEVRRLISHLKKIQE